MTNELDVVALASELPEFGLRQGDIGTVVMVYQNGQAYEVEFVTLQGETIAVATLEPGAIRPVSAHEIAQARQFVGAG